VNLFRIAEAVLGVAGVKRRIEAVEDAQHVVGICLPDVVGGGQRRPGLLERCFDVLAHLVGRFPEQFLVVAERGFGSWHRLCDRRG